jgi:hypothetical protein
LLQSFERDLAERIVTDAGLKSDTAAECGKIVRDDGGGGAESEGHAIGEQFALGDKSFGKAVKNQVEIEFAGDSDVEAWHGSQGATDAGTLRGADRICTVGILFDKLRVGFRLRPARASLGPDYAQDDNSIRYVTHDESSIG